MKYKSEKAKKIGIAAVGTIAAGSLIGCGSDNGQDKYDDWVNSDGAAGRINMEDVQYALEKSDGISDFETKVNEIFEGDNLILVKSEKTSDGRTEISGYEDLDNNGMLDATKDDKLFSAVVGEKDTYTMQGHGSNSYYSHQGHYSMTDMLLFSWMMSSMGRSYSTPMSRTTTIRETRKTYRGSDKYKSQKAKNKSFMKTQKAKNPQKFNNASKSKSTARGKYQSSKQGSFKGKGSSGKGSFKGGS